MVIPDNPDVPPAIHLQTERAAEIDYSVRPFGEVTVTISGGLVDGFLNRPAPLVVDGVHNRRSSQVYIGPAANSDEKALSAGLVDDFLNRPARLINRGGTE